MAEHKPIDLICSHYSDGSVQPIRIRVQDEDGQYQAFSVKEYKDISHQGTKTMPDGVYVTNETLVFECKIVVWDSLRTVMLYANKPYLEWKMTIDEES